MPIPTAVSIELTDEERALLESFTRRHTSAQALALRARIVLDAADRFTNGEIAERQRVSRPTVTKWRGRFAESRVDGLLDEVSAASCRGHPIVSAPVSTEHAHRV